MADIVTFPNDERIREQASFWLIKLEGGQLSMEEKQDLRAWLNINSKHRDVLMELATVWDEMDIMSELADLFPLQRPETVNIFQKIRHYFPPLLPAGIAITSFLLVFLLFNEVELDKYFHQTFKHEEAEITYETSIGKHATFALDDGSTIILNTNSLLNVALSKQKRTLYLKRGEVHFNVAKNPEWPFIVHAGTGMIRAVGTAFSIRLAPEKVDVTVTEGSVEVVTNLAPKLASNTDTTNKNDTTTVILDAGQTMQYNNQTRKLEIISMEQIARKLSWRQGMLIFKGETLEKAIEEINRYSNKRIVITDNQISQIRVGGYFRSGDIDTLLSTLEDSFDIKVNQVNSDIIYLSALEADSQENPD